MSFSARICTFYSDAVSLKHNNIVVPRTAVIYPIYGCNLNCSGCLYRNENKERKMMSFDFFSELIMQLKAYGVQSIEFCGGGEPFFHPDIKKMLTWVTYKAHMPLGGMSNGVCLDDDLIFLVASQMNYLRISVYDNTHKIVRKKLAKLIAMKKLLKTKIRIGAKFTVNKNNYSFIKNNCLDYFDLDLDLITIKAERNTENEISLEQAANLSREFEKIDNPILHCSLGKSKINERCWLTPIHTLIDADANVYICCYYTHREETHRIGNLKETAFKDLWGSYSHISKLNDIKVNECNHYDCRWHHYTTGINSLLKSDALLHQFS